MLNIEEVIKEYTITHFLAGDKSKKIGKDDSFLENDLIDSTGVLELVAFIEENFDIRVEDEELIPENLDSINRLVFYIQSKKNN